MDAISRNAALRAVGRDYALVRHSREPRRIRSFIRGASCELVRRVAHPPIAHYGRHRVRANVRYNCRVYLCDSEDIGARAEVVLSAPLPVGQINYCFSIHSERCVSRMRMFTRSNRLTHIRALCAVTCLLAAGVSSNCQQPSNAPMSQGGAPLRHLFTS